MKEINELNRRLDKWKLDLMKRGHWAILDERIYDRIKSIVEGRVSEEWLHKQAIIFSAISVPAYYEDYVRKLEECLQGFLDEYRKEVMK